LHFLSEETTMDKQIRFSSIATVIAPTITHAEAAAEIKERNRIAKHPQFLIVNHSIEEVLRQINSL
jgi:hypothetical protein